MTEVILVWSLVLLSGLVSLCRDQHGRAFVPYLLLKAPKK